MADITTGELSAIAKEVWHPKNKIWDWMQRGTPTLDSIEMTDSIPMLGRKEGKYIKMAAHVSGNPNPATGVAESGSYPVPGKSSFTNTFWNLKKFVQSLSISEEAMEDMGGGDQSATDIMSWEMSPETGQVKSWRKRMNHYYLGDGSGMVCGTLAAGNTTTNVIVTAAGTTAAMLSQVVVGTELTFKNKTDGSLPTGVSAYTPYVVSAKDTTVDPPTITVLTEAGATPSITTDTNDGIYFFDMQGLAVSGLGIHCSGANPTNWGDSAAYYGGLSRSAQPLWAGYAHTKGTAALVNVQEDLDVVLDKIRERMEGDIPELAGITRFSNYNAVKWQLTRDQRTDGKEKKLKWGHTGVQYENLGLMIDTDANPDKVLVYAPKHLIRYVKDKPFWDDRTGSMWRQQIHSTNSRPIGVYRADVKGREELMAQNCLAAVVISNTGATR